jgi:phosphate-selective porin
MSANIENAITRYRQLPNTSISDEMLIGWIFFKDHPIYGVEYAAIMENMTSVQSLVDTFRIEDFIDNGESALLYLEQYTKLAKVITGDSFEYFQVVNPEPGRTYIIKMKLPIESTSRDYIDHTSGARVSYVHTYDNLHGVYNSSTGVVSFGNMDIKSAGLSDLLSYTLYDLRRV